MALGFAKRGGGVLAYGLELLGRGFLSRLERGGALERPGGVVEADGASVHVSPELATRVSAFNACQRCISEDAASLPVRVYKKLPGGGRQMLPEHAAAVLLGERPNAEMTAQSFRETLTGWAGSYGNGFAWIERKGPTPVALWPLHPTGVWPVRHEESGQLFWVVDRRALKQMGYVVPPPSALVAAGDRAALDSGDMLHVKNMGEGLLGVGVAHLALAALNLSVSAEKFATSFFNNGARLGGVLEHPGQMEAEKKNKLRDEWTRLYTGASNAYKVAILMEGMKYHTLSTPPQEGQMIETRQHQRAEICAFWRVTPHKIQDLTRATFSNVEELETGYVNDTLLPWMRRWEQEAQRKLCGPGEFLRLDANGRLRGNVEKRGGFYTSQFQSGALTPNEMRELEDRDPMEGGDRAFVQVNMQPLAGAKGMAGRGEESGDEVEGRVRG